MDEWKPMQGERIRFEAVGDSVEGELVAIRDGNYFRQDGGKSKVYDIKAENGSIKTVFGTMVMERQLSSVKLGTQIKIVYKGDIATKSGRQAKSYDIFTK